jgi:hypothetical protein
VALEQEIASLLYTIPVGYGCRIGIDSPSTMNFKSITATARSRRFGPHLGISITRYLVCRWAIADRPYAPLHQRNKEKTRLEVSCIVL